MQPPTETDPETGLQSGEAPLKESAIELRNSCKEVADASNRLSTALSRLADRFEQAGDAGVPESPPTVTGSRPSGRQDGHLAADD
jgi:hypothetical protein